MQTNANGIKFSAGMRVVGASWLYGITTKDWRVPVRIAELSEFGSALLSDGSTAHIDNLVPAPKKIMVIINV